MHSNERTSISALRWVHYYFNFVPKFCKNYLPEAKTKQNWNLLCFFQRGCANWQIFFAIWENQNKRNTTENFSTSFNTLGLEGTVAEKLVDNLHVEAKWRLKNASFKLDLHSVTSFSRISFTKFNGKSKIISLSLIFKILQIIIWC